MGPAGSGVFIAGRIVGAGAGAFAGDTRSNMRSADARSIEIEADTSTARCSLLPVRTNDRLSTAVLPRLETTATLISPGAHGPPYIRRWRFNSNPTVPGPNPDSQFDLTYRHGNRNWLAGSSCTGAPILAGRVLEHRDSPKPPATLPDLYREIDRLRHVSGGASADTVGAAERAPEGRVGCRPTGRQAPTDAFLEGGPMVRPRPTGHRAGRQHGRHGIAWPSTLMKRSTCRRPRHVPRAAGSARRASPRRSKKTSRWCDGATARPALPRACRRMSSL
jgi:hypothetical protein